MVYVRTSVSYRVLGQSPPAPSRVCAEARRASAARGDVVAEELIRLLRLPITAEQTALQARRANMLLGLMAGLTGRQARRLSGRLDDRTDPLAQFFDCELSTSLRLRLRGVLRVVAMMDPPRFSVPPGPYRGPRSPVIVPLQPWRPPPAPPSSPTPGPI